jgi:hypothetical protein
MFIVVAFHAVVPSGGFVIVVIRHLSRRAGTPPNAPGFSLVVVNFYSPVNRS